MIITIIITILVMKIIAIIKIIVINQNNIFILVFDAIPLDSPSAIEVEVMDPFWRPAAHQSPGGLRVQLGDDIGDFRSSGSLL